MLRTIHKLTAPLRRAVALMVTRAVLTLINDGTGLQEVQAKLLAGEVMGGLERVQDYGFTSVPLPGAEAVALSVAGHRSHTLIIRADDRRYRLKALKGGEVAIYTDEGDSIHLKRGRLVQITTQTLRIDAGMLVQINSPAVEINANTVDVDAELSMSVDTATHEVTASAQATIQAPAVALGGGTAAATMTGSLHITGDVTTGGDVTSDGDHVAAGVSLTTHVHGGVVAGSEQTGVPE